MIEKINGNQVQQVEQRKASGSGFDKQFEDCLSQALGESQEVGSLESTVSPLSVGSLHEIILNQQTPAELVPMEKTLDLMDRLSTALNDPQATPKSLDPLIQDLNQQAQELLSEADGLPQGDRARSMMEQTAVTAMVQVAKFDRGDFI